MGITKITSNNDFNLGEKIHIFVRTIVLLLALLAHTLSNLAIAQQDLPPEFNGPPPPPVPAEKPDRDALPLYGNTETVTEEQWERFFGQLIVRNVEVPELYPVLPDPDKLNGKAVIVLPGGGYQFVAMQNEGFLLAEQLAEAGYSAFVLKYRTLKTQAGPMGFLEDAGKVFRYLGKARVNDNRLAVDDLFTAVAYLKKACSQFNCEGSELSVIGYSAGARTIIRAMEDRDTKLEVSEAALLYPPMIDPIVAEPDVPLFLTIAQDDPLFKQGGFILPSAWINNGGSLEFHLYNSGGHGFGAVPNGKTSENWITAY